MKENIIHRKTCLLCESDRMELAVPLRPTPVADTYVTEDRLSEAQDLYPLDLYLCRHCGHVQYWILWIRNYCSGNISILPRLLRGQWNISENTSEVTRRVSFANKGLVVDGSNDGTALRFFREGLRFWGLILLKR